MKLPEVLSILDTVIETFLEDEEMYSTTMLAKLKLRPATLTYWRKQSEEVVNKLAEIKELQEMKIISALLNTKNRNTSGLIFYCKSRLQMIEYEKEIQLNRQNEITDFKLEVNYQTVPSRTDLEIDAIITDVEDE